MLLHILYVWVESNKELRQKYLELILNVRKNQKMELSNAKPCTLLSLEEQIKLYSIPDQYFSITGALHNVSIMQTFEEGMPPRSERILATMRLKFKNTGMDALGWWGRGSKKLSRDLAMFFEVFFLSCNASITGANRFLQKVFSLPRFFILLLIALYPLKKVCLNDKKVGCR